MEGKQEKAVREEGIPEEAIIYCDGLVKMYLSDS